MLEGITKLKFYLLVVAFLGACMRYTIAAEPLGTPSVDDIEYPDDEPHSALEIELGKTLYFDPILSFNKSQSCATCHNPELGFGDGMNLSVGAKGAQVPRNAPHIYNLAWNVIFMWDGRKATLEEQALGPIEAEGEMNMPLDVAVSRLEGVSYYKKTFKEVYGEDSITPELLGRAIAAFERTIISNNSPFDKYMAGDQTAMSPEAIRGLALFKGKAKCIDCHDGPNFTDNSFHNIGLKSDDEGRAAIIGDSKMKKAFKTPGLRNTLLTAPYMHNGSLGSLYEVVQHYNKGGEDKEGISNLIQPLGLTELEISELIAFMGALTDPVIVSPPTIPE